ncbi:MAG: beta-galactosidase [Clostridia bacterium]|nr:beta-galactosidase [Clostridia bacterium]
MHRLIKVGKIKPLASIDSKNTKFGIGLEKLDRNVFAPSKTYDKLGELGAKYVRLQSGWARTEKQENVYDFLWLDEIVDNLIARGMEPWICMCYGNGLYTEKANEIFGCVGVPPIFSEREKNAWANYCKATAKHFEGRVKMYEVWNEPDGNWCWKHGASGKEYGEFVIATSKAIKSVVPSAKILAGSIANRNNIVWTKDMFETGIAPYIDAITYHEYTNDETRVLETVRYYKAFIKKYGEHIKLIQGESGCPSVPETNGALRNGHWSEDKQAKLLLRRQLIDLISEVEFSSHFTTVDMIEALNGKAGDLKSYLDYGYFGVLRVEFDENGFAVGEYAKKPSYYAYQNFIALFGQGAKKQDLPIILKGPDYTEKVFGNSEKLQRMVTQGFVKENGSSAFLYYRHADIMTESYDGVVSFACDEKLENIRLIDLMSGNVYKIPERMVEDLGSGFIRLNFLPIKDYPFAITFGDFCEVE